ncbi:MAG TPA: enoyl-CoA hydratase/isomerase family protein [Candidatus Binataceae bacterium]|nr:enoyl-CoA hydratase/isomerase family protein [Candidatus Binataceae bacterium]
MADVVSLKRNQNWATLSLNRPDKRNALNVEVLQGMDKALREVESDKEIRALVVRGEGRHFCAGIDLAEVEQAESGHNPASLEGVFRRLEQIPAITIAAVQGAAIAGGLELALHCDLRIAADDVKCGMTLGKVGLMVPYDFTRKLIEVCGAANTSLILYTADLFDAKRVYEMGMMSQVVPAAELDKTVSALAEKIAGNAPLSLRAMKATVRRCMSETFDAWHEDMLALATAVRRSNDAKEGPRAFLEKRKPNWRGE